MCTGRGDGCIWGGGGAYGHLKLPCEGVDARMLEELFAVGIGLGDAGVGFESGVPAFADAAGEVFAVVEVFEDGADGLEVLVGEGYGAVLTGEAC